MKRLLIILVLLTAAPATISAQIERQIASIRAEVGLINKSAPKYRKITRTVDGISLEGTEATYFISGRGLKKITARMYGETFRATVEAYYSGEEMIFAYQRLQKYDTHIAMKPPPRVVSTEETRIYYSGPNAIRILRGKASLAASDVAFDEADTSMREIADRLKAALKT